MKKDVGLQARDVAGNLHDISLGELSWRPSVYAIVINDGQILMSPKHGLGYDLPGGGIEMNETIERALIREVKEETGLEVSVNSLAGAYDNLFVWKPDEPSRRRAMHSVLLYYVCDLEGGEITTEGFDEEEKSYAEEAVWIPVSSLSDISLASSYDFREIIYRCLTNNTHVRQ